jgi:NADH-quinone oxidoreductase subunit L
VINLPALFGAPAAITHELGHWLHPVVEVGEADIEGTWAEEHPYFLVIIAVGVVLIGLIGAWLVYLKKRVKAFEPTILANAWNYDRAVSWFMGGPGRAGFQGVADFDATVVDGAVNGVGLAVKEVATEARKGQTGYVRQYGAIIGIGVVLLLGWFVVIRGIL